MPIRTARPGRTLTGHRPGISSSSQPGRSPSLPARTARIRVKAPAGPAPSPLLVASHAACRANVDRTRAPGARQRQAMRYTDASGRAGGPRAEHCQDATGDHRRRHRSAGRARTPLRRPTTSWRASAIPARWPSSASTPPAAIVLDLDLTTFDALELLRLITSDPDLRGVAGDRALASSDFTTFEQAHRFGAAEYVTKPFSPEELGAKLDDLSSGRTAERRRAAQGSAPCWSPAGSSPGADRQRARPPAATRRPARRGAGREGLVTEQDIVTAVAGQMRIGVVDLAEVTPSANAWPAPARLHRPPPPHAAEPRRRRRPRRWR